MGSAQSFAAVWARRRVKLLLLIESSVSYPTSPGDALHTGPPEKRLKNLLHSLSLDSLNQNLPRLVAVQLRWVDFQVCIRSEPLNLDRHWQGHAEPCHLVPPHQTKTSFWVMGVFPAHAWSVLLLQPNLREVQPSQKFPKLVILQRAPISKVSILQHLQHLPIFVGFQLRSVSVFPLWSVEKRQHVYTPKPTLSVSSGPRQTCHHWLDRHFLQGKYFEGVGQLQQTVSNWHLSETEVNTSVTPSSKRANIAKIRLWCLHRPNRSLLIRNDVSWNMTWA